MANKRMFTMKIVDSDAFLDMPLSTQCLYFHLCMRADDDGFVDNSKRIMKLIGANDDDLRVLIAKRFVLTFTDSSVMVIKHWRMHNTLSNCRYHETTYIDEKNQLLIKENGSYSFSSGIPIDDSKTVALFTGDSPAKNQRRISGETAEDKRRTSGGQTEDADLGLDIDIGLDKDIDKSKGSKAAPLDPFPELSGDLREATANWLKYKIEKRQPYKPTGLRNLVSQILNNAEKYGSEAVVELIRECMSNNYQGIIFDRLKKGNGYGKSVHGNSGKDTAERTFNIHYDVY